MDFEIHAIDADEWEQVRELRLAALQDAPDAFGEKYENALALPEENWRARARKGALPESRVLAAVAKADGRWIGTLRMGLADQSTAEEPLPAQVDVLPALEIMGVFVRPEHRGGGSVGVATRLVDEVCTRARAKFGIGWAVLDVRLDNARAIAFYRRLGFEQTSIRLPGDAPGEEEVRMVKQL